MALVANCHRDPKRHSKPYTPADFITFDDEPKANIPVGIEALKVFLTPEELAKANAKRPPEPEPPPCRSTTTNEN